MTTRFPADLARELTAERVVALPKGGSPATVWQVDRAYEVLAVKVMSRRAGGVGRVDGHDVATFLRKPVQVAQLRRGLPELAAHHVEVVGVWDRPNWVAYAMPFVAQPTLVSPEARPEETSWRLAAVYGTLTEHGYSRTRRVDGRRQLHELYLDRVRARLPVLRGRVPDALLRGPPVVVNGRRCPTLERQLARIAADRDLTARLGAAVASYPVHGDLNLGNILGSAEYPADFRLLDPRGTLAYRDPVYDFAKSLLSLTVFDRAMTWGLRVSRGPNHCFDVRLADPHVHYPGLAPGFVAMLGRLAFGRELDRTDPHWRFRLGFAHAIHTLAESACRLSDAAPRRPRAGQRDAVTLATGFLALGLRLLDQVVTAHPDSSASLADVSTGLDDLVPR